MHNLFPSQSDSVQLACQVGPVDVGGLASQSSVTRQTTRKELNELCDRGVMQRYHGGAMLSSGVTDVAYDARRHLATFAKQQIGPQAAALISPRPSWLARIRQYWLPTT